MSDDAGIEARRRDRRRSNFERMLNARSIAFIGGRATADAANYCRDLGFAGDIWSVNPRVDTIADLPSAPEAAWIAMSAERTIGAVRELAAMGTAGVVCYAAGFAEVGNGHLEKELAEAAGDMALVGPNSIGVINFLDRIALVAAAHGLQRPMRGIACIAQSGTVVANMVTSERSVPITHLISVGNQCGIDLADAIDTVAHDPRVRAIMLYVEGIKDAGALADAARTAFEKGKPIVCMKAGKSDAGRAIASTHTGRLAGEPGLYTAFLERLGIIQVERFSELLEMSKLLALDGLPAGNRLLIETCSGMDSGACADLAERHGIELPQPTDDVRAALKRVLPSIATPMNPLDVTMAQWGDRDAQAKSLITLMTQPADAAAIVVNAPSTVHLNGFDEAFHAMLDVRRVTEIPCCVISNLPEGIPRATRELLIENGIIPLQGLEDAFACLGHAARFVKRRGELASRGGPSSRLIGRGMPEAAHACDEWTSKSALADFGVAFPAGELCTDAGEAIAVAEALGYPVAVKGVGTGIAHKTELGAVAIGLADATSVSAASRSISQLPGVESLIVEKMIGDGVAEFIVGVKRDGALGLALLLGTGGVFAELLDDTATLLLPSRRAEIEDALLSLRGHVLLSGFRGRPTGDFDALVETIMAVCTFAEAKADTLIELDLNPVIVRPDGLGAVAVDAMMTMGEDD